jgi:hypothetical protein
VSRELALEIGKTYFSVFYADERLHHPVFETLIYLGPETFEREHGGVPGHLFQYAESFHSDGNWKEMSAAQRDTFEEAPVVTFEAAHLDPIVDSDGLIEELTKWQARIR